MRNSLFAFPPRERTPYVTVRLARSHKARRVGDQPRALTARQAAARPPQRPMPSMSAAAGEPRERGGTTAQRGTAPRDKGENAALKRLTRETERRDQGDCATLAQRRTPLTRPEPAPALHPPALGTRGRRGRQAAALT